MRSSEKSNPNKCLANQLVSYGVGIVGVLLLGFFILVYLEPPKTEPVAEVAHKTRVRNRFVVTQASTFKQTSAPSRPAERATPSLALAGATTDKPLKVDIAENMKAAIELVDSGRAGSAVDLLEEVLKVDPANEEALVELGMIQLIDFNSPADALGFFKKALVANPSNRIVASELVNIYVELDDFQGGVQTMDEILSADPKNVNARVAKAQLLNGQGKSDAAISEFEALTKNPEAPSSVWMDLGNMQAQNGNPKKAIETFSKAADLATQKIMENDNPDMKRALVEQRNMALLQEANQYIALGKNRMAKEILIDILSTNPNDYLAKKALSKLKSNL